MNLTLLRNYLRSASRNLYKNSIFSAINIFGLAISMSVGLLIITFISELNSYDNFQEKSDRIYRVTNTYQYLDNDPSLFASTSVLTGKRIREEVAGLEEVVVMRRNFSGDFGESETKIPLRGYYASEGFFNTFTFRLIEGDAKTALKEPYSIVITTKAAEKLFAGHESYIGKVLITPDNKQYTITGVMDNPPFNSHLDFEVLSSFSTRELEDKDSKGWLSWTNMWMYHVYILLDEGIARQDIEPALAQISDEENAKDEFTKINLGLLNIANITPGPDMSNNLGKTTQKQIPIMLAVFALIVLISACFNYTNLSIARSLRRAKEVGVRKVIGSSSGQIFNQFILESIIIALISLVLAFGIFYVLRPSFIALDEEVSEMVRMNLDWQIVLRFFLLALATGVVAGILPAILYARISANNVLRSALSLNKVKGLTLRKALIVIQFTLSVMFILAATLQYRQFKYAMSFDLGYQTSNILNIELQGNSPELIKSELLKLPEVDDVSASMMVTSVGSYWGESLKYKNPLDSITVYYNGIDEKYLPLHGHKLLAGSNFAPLSNDSSSFQIIVNEQVLKRFNLGSPQEAIGVVLKMDKKEARITGVVQDFHYGTLSSEVKPFLFKYQSEDFYRLNVKFHPNSDLFSAREKVEKAWNQLDDIHTLDATFYDTMIEEQYGEFAVMVKIIGVLAFLAITIAALGLLGMVMFTAETRLKEISIRKVLGASETSLVYLLGRGFLLLLILASLIAVPATIYIFTEVVLSDVAYHASIGIFDTVFAPLLVLIIGVLTISVITMFAARTNPATILRNE